LRSLLSPSFFDSHRVLFASFFSFSTVLAWIRTVFWLSWFFFMLRLMNECI
jgi:hypothetical protein